MKRSISLLLVIILAISAVGCSSETATQKTEEELRAEVKAEMEKEEKLKEEIRQELTEELKNEKSNENLNYDPNNNSNHNSNQDNQEKQKGNEQYDKMLLKGKVISEPGIAYGVAVDEAIDVDGHSTNELYLAKINIKDYLDRNYFTYQIYENGVLKDDYNGVIDIEVLVDKNSFTYHDEVGAGADVLQIVSLDGEKHPSYKANQDFPIDYYVDTFWWYLENISTEGHMYTKDIKNFDFYKEIDDFKIAVDKILESGSYINMAEGDYYIEDESKNYSDGEVDMQTEAQDTNSKSEGENVIPPGTFEEITPSEPETKKTNDYTKGYSYEVRDNALYVTYNNTGNTEEVLRCGKEYKLYNGFAAASVSKGSIQEIKNLKHSADWNKLYFLNGGLYSYSFSDGKIEWYTFDRGDHTADYRLVDSGEYSGYYAIKTTDGDQKLYNNDGKKIMEIESIYASNITEAKKDEGNPIMKEFSSETINGTTVDYSKYCTVIVPFYEGKYKEKLSNNSENPREHYVQLGGVEKKYKQGETQPMVMSPRMVYKDKVEFAVFGRLNKVTIKFIDDANNRKETKVLKNLENNLVTVLTNFVNDRTRIEVSFSTMHSDGTTYNGSFTMNDMKDSSEYEPIMVEDK